MIPRTVASFSGAVLSVSLQDVSFADAPAITLARASIAGLSHSEGTDTIIPFSIDAGALLILPSHDYTVRACVNVAPDGTPHAEDLFSDRRHPVLTRGHGNRVDIRVTPSPTGTAR